MLRTTTSSASRWLAISSLATALVGCLAAGCSSADAPSDGTITESPVQIKKSLSGRYEPMTAEGAPTSELYGISSLWFNGNGDYQMVTANCDSDCEETGVYSIDASNVLTLKSFKNIERSFHLDSLLTDAAPASETVNLENTGGSSGGAGGSGSGGSGACGTTDQYQSSDESSSSSSCNASSAPSGAARGVGMTPKSGPKVGDGKSSAGASSMGRTGGGQASPTAAHKQTVTLLYLGSPAFLKRCAGGKYGCGQSVDTYPESDLYFSAPLHTVSCGGKAKFCKGTTCVTATRVESSDSHQHFEGSNGLIRALGDTPVDPSKGCSGGSGTITGVTIAW